MQKSNKELWIGGRYRRQTEERWYWVDDTPIDWYDPNWADPIIIYDDDYSVDNECVMIGETGPDYWPPYAPKWQDRECKLRRHFVCQVPHLKYFIISKP